jgi:hypothetical protein
MDSAFKATICNFLGDPTIYIEMGVIGLSFSFSLSGRSDPSVLLKMQYAGIAPPFCGW